MAEGGQPGVSVEFSDTLNNAVTRGGQDANAERQRIERQFNDGLRELGKTNPAAQRLLNSRQTIRIVCYGDPEAGDRKPSGGILGEPAESIGDFGDDGNPRPGGRAIFIIDCDTVQARGGFFRVPEGGFTPALFNVLVHELFHATHRDRRHGPGLDSMDIYRQWERDFAQALARVEDANKKKGSNKNKKVALKQSADPVFNEQTRLTEPYKYAGGVRYDPFVATPQQRGMSGMSGWIGSPGTSVSVGGNTGRYRVPSVGFGTAKLGGTVPIRMDYTDSRINMRGYSLGIEHWSDARLFAAMDSLESLATGSSMVFGSVHPSISGSLEALYDEDDYRDFDGPPRGWRFGWKLNLNGLDGRGSESASEPFLGGFAGHTYIKDNPASGSTGVDITGWGNDVTAKTKIWQRDMTAAIMLGRWFGPFMVSPGFRLTFDQLDQKHDIHGMSPSFTADQYSYDLEYDVDENRFGPGLSLDVGYKYNKYLTFTGGVGLDLLYRDAKLDVMQDNRCGACGGAETRYIAKVSDSDSGASLDANIHAGVMLDLAKNVKLQAGVTHKIRSDVAEINDRYTPAANPPSLDTGSSSNTNFNLGVRISF